MSRAPAREPTQAPAQALAQALAQAGRPGPLGLAVSGGGDSMALMYLAADWARAHGVALAVATVDHGLRPEAAAEARAVADAAAALGLPHDTLIWAGQAARGNLPDAARRARYGLLADWARGRGLAAVALGHSRDDVAETFLMRLARGAGVDGLAMMRADWRDRGMRWLRPLLAVGRAELRDELRRRGVGWIEDPTNDDEHYLRVRARRALAQLAPLGLTAEGIAATAARLADARGALEWQVQQAARQFGTSAGGDVVLAAGIRDLPADIRHRLVQGALLWLTRAPWPPRRRALIAALDEVLAGRVRTLAGCLLRPEAGGLRICREYQAVSRLCSPPGALWDGRWQMIAPAAGAWPEGAEVRALGAGLDDCPDWRATGLPRTSLRASPALWQGARLIAAPLAGLGAGWQAALAPPADFHAFLLSH